MLVTFYHHRFELPGICYKVLESSLSILKPATVVALALLDALFKEGRSSNELSFWVKSLGVEDLLYGYPIVSQST